MNQVPASAYTFAKDAFNAANNGIISQHTLSEAMTHLAELYFGGRMGALLASPVGKIFLQPRAARTSAYEEGELHKREGRTPGNDQGNLADPAYGDMGDAGDNALTGDDVDKAVAALMKLGFSKDESWGKIAAAEKTKAFGPGY